MSATVTLDVDMPSGQMPNELNIDGLVDRGIRYIGKAVQSGTHGTYRCLANVGGSLCVVEVTIKIDWRARAEKAEAELARWHTASPTRISSPDDLSTAVINLTARAEAAEKRAGELEGWIRSHGQHTQRCLRLQVENKPAECTCGLSALLGGGS